MSDPPGLRGALGDLGLRPRKRRAAPGSGESARGCHFKLKREREGGGQARGSARRAPGSVPGLRRSSRLPPRPGRAPGPRRAPPRRPPGDNCRGGVAGDVRAWRRCVRAAGGRPGAGNREPRVRSREPGARAGAERRPLRGAGVSSTRPPPRTTGNRSGAGTHVAPLPSAADPGLRALCTPTLIALAHVRRAQSTPGALPGPATPRTAHHIAPRTPVPRVHTRDSPGHLHASPAPVLHERPSLLHSAS